jgi:hypothetical protein
MSLNRMEQIVHSHIVHRPEEKRHWQDKVTRLATLAASDHAAADAVAAELAAYCRERAGVVAEFRGLAGPGGPSRLLLRNLAELLLRQWVAPRRRRPPDPAVDSQASVAHT